MVQRHSGGAAVRTLPLGNAGAGLTRGPSSRRHREPKGGPPAAGPVLESIRSGRGSGQRFWAIFGPSRGAKSSPCSGRFRVPASSWGCASGFMNATWLPRAFHRRAREGAATSFPSPEPGPAPGLQVGEVVWSAFALRDDVVPGHQHLVSLGVDRVQVEVEVAVGA